MDYFPNTRRGLQEAWINRREPEQVRVLARVYWKSALLFIAFVALLATLYSALSVFSLGLGAPIVGPTVSAPQGPTLNQEELKALAEEFSSREARYQNLKANPAQMADPSR